MSRGLQQLLHESNLMQHWSGVGFWLAAVDPDTWAAHRGRLFWLALYDPSLKSTSLSRNRAVRERFDLMRPGRLCFVGGDESERSKNEVQFAPMKHLSVLEKATTLLCACGVSCWGREIALNPQCTGNAPCSQFLWVISLCRRCCEWRCSHGDSQRIPRLFLNNYLSGRFERKQWE